MQYCTIRFDSFDSIHKEANYHIIVGMCLHTYEIGECDHARSTYKKNVLELVVAEKNVLREQNPCQKRSKVNRERENFTRKQNACKEYIQKNVLFDSLFLGLLFGS